MDYEELIGLANNGDVEAMLSLGRYCQDKGTVEGHKEALEWFTKASQTGDKYASLKAAIICVTLAPLYEDHDMIDEAYEMWSKGALFTAEGLPSSDEDMDFFDSIISIQQQACYGSAVCLYFKKEYSRAIEFLRMTGEETPKVKVLFAICQAAAAIATEDDSDLRDAIREIAGIFLSAFTSGSDYVTTEGVGKARTLEQIILAVGANLFSDVYMQDGRVDGNQQIAQELVTRTYHALTDERAKAIISEKYDLE